MSKTRNPDALIRIEDAIKVLCREKCYPGSFCPDNYCVEMWDKFEDVERVDAVPVVRCKDCKHWRKYTDEQLGECMTTIRDTKVTRSDDYCSEGERKDGEQNG